MFRTIYRKGFKWWFYCHCPGKRVNGQLVYDQFTLWEGLITNWWIFVQWAPLLTLLRPSWWRMVWNDKRETCGCGRTWFQYRLLPALVGDRRLGGGC